MIVDGVARLVGNEMTTERTAYESHIAENVEQLVAGRFVLPLQGAKLEETQMTCITMFNTEFVGQHVKLLLRHDAVINDKGIAEVAATYQSHLEERNDLTDENESTSCGKVRGEATEIVKMCRLCRDEFTIVEIDGGVNRKTCRGGTGDGVSGQRRLNAKPTACSLIVILDGLLDGKIIAGGILLEQPDTIELLDEEAATAVKDGEFRAIDLYEAVVDATSKESSHGMLYGRDSDAGIVGMGNHCAAGSVNDVFCQSRYDGLSWQVYALYLQAMTRRGGKESGSQFKTRVEAFAAERKRS